MPDRSVLNRIFSGHCALCQEWRIERATCHFKRKDKKLLAAKAVTSHEGEVDGL